MVSGAFIFYLEGKDGTTTIRGFTGSIEKRD
jgi:hypothetical protein